jgi:hypothetical protein
MPSRWHEIVGSVEQNAGGDEIVGIRGAASEGVHGHDFDVRCVLATHPLEYFAQAGIGAGDAVLCVHCAVKTSCEGGPVATARRREPVVGSPYRDERRSAVSVASEDAREVNAAEGEQAQLPCRSADLDDALECRYGFVDVAGLFEDTAERVEV